MPRANKGRGGKSKAKAKGKAKSPSPAKSTSPSPDHSPKSNTPPTSPQQPPEEQDVGSTPTPSTTQKKDTPSTTKERDDGASCGAGASKPKKKKITATLTAEQEDNMVEWFRTNLLLYDKKLKDFKDASKKDAKWAEQALALDLEKQVIKVWYMSIRTRLSRLVKPPKSGDAAVLPSDRDKWILHNFSWLKTHLKTVKRTLMVSIRAKQQAANLSSPGCPPTTPTTPITPFDDDDDDVSQCDDDDGSQVDNTAPMKDVIPKRIPGKHLKAEEGRMMVQLQRSREQADKLQLQMNAKMLSMWKPEPETERTAYVALTKTQMVTLDESVWLDFEEEHSLLMRRYKRLSDAAKSGQSPAPSPYKVQVPTAQYQPAASQYQFPTWQPQYTTLETPQRSTARLQPANQPTA